jgi:uncharacterized protein
MSAGAVGVLVGFGRALRAAGLEAGQDRLQAMLRALDHLDVGCRTDVYWAGRLTLCANPEDIQRYDRAFAAYFTPGHQPPRPPWTDRLVPLPAGPDLGVDETGSAADLSELPVARLAASSAEILRHRDVARLSAWERDELRRLLALLRPAGPVRPSRRFRPARRGPVDPGRTLRAMLRRGGEPARPLRHARRSRPRRLVLLVDVSGSMRPYADALLRFAHAATTRRPGTEVFTVGTRLTRVSRELRTRDPDAALAAVAGAVPDWSGGTRLGELVKAFLDRWGQRGMARGAVVVIASDGWERGDATLLGDQMARLARLAHRVVWVNPHRGKPGYQPLTAGMRAALPYVDDFVAGHTLAAMEELCAVLAGAGTPPTGPPTAPSTSPPVRSSPAGGPVPTTAGGRHG